MTTFIQPIDELLARLNKVKATKPGHWSACCPAHQDRFPSLSVRLLDDGRILIHCFAGCSVEAVLSAINLELSDLFPNSLDSGYAKPERRPFPAADVLRALHYETLVVSAAAGALLVGKPFSDADRDRLAVAVDRIQAAVSLSGVGQHG